MLASRSNEGPMRAGAARLFSEPLSLMPPTEAGYLVSDSFAKLAQVAAMYRKLARPSGLNRQSAERSRYSASLAKQ